MTKHKAAKRAKLEAEAAEEQWKEKEEHWLVVRCAVLCCGRVWEGVSKGWSVHDCVLGVWGVWGGHHLIAPLQKAFFQSPANKTKLKLPPLTTTSNTNTPSP